VSAAERFAPGAVLGKFALVREVGRGGMCAVFEARHTDLDMRVAVKVLLPRYADNPAVVERFLREGRAASRINHRHAIRMVDVGSTDAGVFLAMEFLEGEDLARRLRRGGPLAAAEAVDLLLPVASVIAEAHAGGVIHRDLKPANVFLARDRFGVVEPKVLDFGISKIEDDGSSTAADLLLGTPHFMAPEQFAGSQHASAWSDQYALGVMLYQCVTGRLPFRGESTVAIFQAVTAGSFTPPRELVATIPEGLERAILRAMSLDPAQRFASVTAFAAAIVEHASPAERALWAPRLTGGEGLAGTAPSDTVAEDAEARTTVLTAATTPFTGDRTPRTSDAVALPAAGPSARVLTLAGVAALALLALAATVTLRGPQRAARPPSRVSRVVVATPVPAAAVTATTAAIASDVPMVREPASTPHDPLRAPRRRGVTARPSAATRDPNGAIVIR
jgi:hypothetical protein